MLTSNISLVLAVGGVLTILIIVQITLALRHDHSIAAAPKFETLASLDARIGEKRATLLDLENDLRLRREALANLADMQAELEQTTRRRDEVLREWATLDEKRAEVRAVREETEAAVIERQSVLAELSQAQADLDEMKGRIESAERLIRDIDDRRRQLDGLVSLVEEQRGILAQLDDAERRLGETRERAARLESEVARSQGLLDATLSDLSEVDARVHAQRDALAALEITRGDLQAQIADARARHQQLVETLDNEARELAQKRDERSTQEARLASLEALVEAARSTAGQLGENAIAAEDPLRDLKMLPPVLQGLSDAPDYIPGDEAAAIKGVADRMRDSGLTYHPRVLRAFHTAMKVNETTQMAVLAGISGTGKSQLPRVYAAGMGIGFLQVPVQPRWDSPQDLMGFYNYIERRFRPTDMARALWHLDGINNADKTFSDQMMLVLLDEMNLARVEYYFSDFLSRLESRPPRDRVGDRNARKDAEIELEIPVHQGESPPRIFPGYNLLFAGTMNEDESTQSLSDKVVDRANVLRFAAPTRIHNGATGNVHLPDVGKLSWHRWQSWVRSTETLRSNHKVSEKLDQMVTVMKEFGRPIGHRLGRSILAYVANYPQVEGADPIENALCDQIEMRLLPKLRGIDVDGAETAFSTLRALVDELADDVLSAAINSSVDTARHRGQFVWQGVTR